LVGGQRVSRALRAYRADRAQRLGLELAPVAGGSTFSVRVEELGAVAAPAQPHELPLPDVGDGAGKPAYVRHRGCLLLHSTVRTVRSLDRWYPSTSGPKHRSIRRISISDRAVHDNCVINRQFCGPL